jgi:hypothetical protein
MFQSPRNCSKPCTPNSGGAGCELWTLALKKNQRIKMKNGKNKAGAGQKKGDRNKPKTSESDPKTAALNRHKGHCTVCSHEKCKEIEAAFVAWESPEKIAVEFGWGTARRSIGTQRLLALICGASRTSACRSKESSKKRVIRRCKSRVRPSYRPSRCKSN